MYVFKSIQDLIFPNVCLHCHTTITHQNQTLCIACYSDLVFTDFHIIRENIAYKRMLHLTNIYAGGALLFFKKGYVIQSLIHELKYHGNQDVGIYFGKLIGERLLSQELYQDVDQIIPVPLHSKKKKLRGYNQAEIIAKEIGSVLGISVLNNILVRTKDTETQTKKTVEERVQNVKNVFSIQHNLLLSKKHILIIDDVFTTGATFSSCIETIRQYTSAKISFYCIALVI
ncbi:MAG: ComF family protein [Chitinophagaceae bacterium]